MSAVTGLQIWTMIGSFSALMVGGFGMMMWLIRSEVGGLRGEFKSEIGGLRGEFKSEIGGLRAEMKSEIGGLRGEFKSEIGGLRAEIGGLRMETISEVGGLRNEMGARFDDVNHRLDALHADMHLVKTHLFGKIPA